MTWYGIYDIYTMYTYIFGKCPNTMVIIYIASGVVYKCRQQAEDFSVYLFTFLHFLFFF